MTVELVHKCIQQLHLLALHFEILGYIPGLLNGLEYLRRTTYLGSEVSASEQEDMSQALISMFLGSSVSASEQVGMSSVLFSMFLGRAGSVSEQVSLRPVFFQHVSR